MFLKYIETGETTDDYTKGLDKAVVEVRCNEKWRNPIMTVEMLIKDAVRAAKKEAEVKGRVEGKADEQKATVFRMLEANMTAEQICIATALTEEELRPMIKDYHSGKKA